MTALGQRLIGDLRLRNFSPHTVQAYVRAVAHFSRHFGRSPEQLRGEQVRTCLLHLVKERKVSWSLYNQTRCACSDPRVCSLETGTAEQPHAPCPACRRGRMIPGPNLSGSQIRDLILRLDSS